MSIDSLALAINDFTVSGTAANGGKTAAGTSNGGDSMFQKLIAQMLSQHSATDVNVTGTGKAATQGSSQAKQDEISELLSELLLGGGSLTKLKLMNLAGQAKETADAAETKETAGKDSASCENGVSIDLMAMLLGLTNGSNGIVEPASESKTAASGVNPSISAIHAANSLQINGAVKSAQETGQNSDESFGFLTGMKIAEPAKLPANESKATVEGTEILNRTEQTLTEGSGINKEAGANTEMQIPAAVSKKIIAASGKQEATQVSEKVKQDSEGKILQAEPDYSGPIQAQSAPNDTAASGISVQSAEKLEPYSQIGAQILSKLEQDGPKEFKMQLEPEDLGQIDIKLKLNDGKLMIDILAASSKTQALLTSQVDKLISSMGLQNVQVESVQVSQQMNSQSQDSQQNQGTFNNSGMDFSQRKHHDQSQEELFKANVPTGAVDPQDEFQSSELTDRISLYRYASHRMNFAV